MEDLTLNSNYISYCILGKVLFERDKLQYLNPWMKCFDLLDDLLSDCKTKQLHSEQLFQTITKINKDGQLRYKYKLAPTGGKQKWNKNNNEKICKKYLEDKLQEIEEYEKLGLSYYEGIINSYPQKKSHVVFLSHDIYANIDNTVKIGGNEFYDFFFLLSQSLDIKTNEVYNQEINIQISERYAKMKEPEVIDKFIQQIGKLSFAVKIAKTSIPYMTIEKRIGQSDIKHVLVGRGYGFGQSLTLQNNPTNEWITIFENK